jgi:hypothetical protein
LEEKKKGLMVWYWKKGKKGMSFKTSFSRDFLGSTRAGNPPEETDETQRDKGQGNLHFVGAVGARGLSIGGIGPSVDVRYAIKLPRYLSLVEG